MISILKTGLLAATLAAAGSVATAATIDSFDTTLTTGMVTGVAGASTTVSDTNPPATGYIGTGRSITATIDSTLDSQNARAAASSNGLGNGRFEFESTDNMVGSFVLSYSGIGGLDFTGTPVLVFEDTNNDAAFDIVVTLNGGASRAFTIAAGGSLTDYELDLQGLAGLSSVSALEIAGTSQVLAGDISFELVNVEAVPLPAALPLLLAGFGGLAMVGRRRRAG